MRPWRAAFVVVIVLGIAPNCSTAAPCSNHEAPHATFDLAKGCSGYYCAMTCDDGFNDCNGDEIDGCETAGSCNDAQITPVDAGGSS